MHVLNNKLFLFQVNFYLGSTLQKSVHHVTISIIFPVQSFYSINFHLIEMSNYSLQSQLLYMLVEIL